MAKKPAFERVKGEYESLFAGASIRPQHKAEVMATARRILSNRSRYEKVSAETGVPWVVIGLLHNMECSLSFEKHLHNGDPLHRATVRVPKGRGPFGSWEESAADALRIDKLDKVDWSTDVVPRIAYMAETFNGLGYRAKHINIPSPYLWSFTTAYERGKFIRDGVYSPVAVSQQVGVMAALRAILELQPDALGAPVVVDEMVPSPKAVVPEPPAPSPVAVATRSWSVRGLVAVVGAKVSDFFLDVSGWVSEKLDTIVEIARKTNDDATGAIAPLASLGTALRLNLAQIGFWITVIVLLVVVVRHARDKAELEAKRAEEKLL